MFKRHSNQATEPMKNTRWLVWGLCLMASACGAQEFTEPGWFSATWQLTPAPAAGGATKLSKEPTGGEQLGLLGGSTSAIAEAVTPEIQALARGLQNDPLRIFNYVHEG
jgi:hypothetical protein